MFQGSQFYKLIASFPVPFHRRLGVLLPSCVVSVEGLIPRHDSCQTTFLGEKLLVYDLTGAGINVSVPTLRHQKRLPCGRYFRGVQYCTCRHLLCTKSRGGACLVFLLIGVSTVFLAIAVATLTKLDKMVAN